MKCNVSTNPNVSRNYTEEERTCYLAHLQLYSTYTMIPAIIFLGVLCVVGIIGNSIVLFVYSQRFRSTASGTFIMAIAVFDLMANIILIPGDIHAMFHYWDFDMVYPCKLRQYGHAVTHGASSFFLVALALTRYRKICKPFNSQVSVKQARIICIGLSILAMIYPILYFIVQGIQKTKTPNPNIFGHVCNVDDTFNGTTFHKLNTALFFIIFMAVSVLFVVFYVKIWVKAKQHHNRKPNKCARGVLEQETEKTGSAGVNCKQTSNTCTSIDSILVHVNKETQAGQSIELLEQTSSLPKRFLEIESLERNTMLVSNLYHVPEPQPRSPDGIKVHQNSTRNKAISRSCEYVDRVPSAEESSSAQMNYPSILKKSVSVSNNFKSDLNVHIFCKENKTTLDNFEYNETLSEESKKIKIKNKNTRNCRGSRRITRMIVTISLIYILGSVTFLVLDIIKTVDPEFPESMNIYVQCLYHVLLRSYLINTAVNPIVYSVCDVKFRTECLSQFKRIACY